MLDDDNSRTIFILGQAEKARNMRRLTESEPSLRHYALERQIVLLLVSDSRH